MLPPRYRRLVSRMARVTHNLSLRLPPELYERLSDSAMARHRSVNQEIIDRLIHTFKDQYDPAPPLDDLRNRLLRLEKAYFGDSED